MADSICSNVTICIFPTVSQLALTCTVSKFPFNITTLEGITSLALLAIAINRTPRKKQRNKNPPIIPKCLIFLLSCIR